ncbi:winged helix-turn-helix domain-containing protein [Streptomyces sp. x-19]|uniref:winged helix-turn-helix domain-containing protein n=1 Tax=Streptomyces sp. x-19 TaxID=2789280 RepID=UPI003980294E
MADEPLHACDGEQLERAAVMRYPFSLERIIKCMRGMATCDRRERTLQVGDVTLDPVAGTVMRAGNYISLSASGRSLLHCLMRNPAQWVSRDSLLREVWGSDFEQSTDLVATYMGYLHRQLDSERAQLLFRDHSLGYMIKAADSS